MQKLTKSENIILRFMNTVYQKGITIYMDNFYLGPGFIENLTKSGVKCIGTVKKHRILSQSKFDYKIEKHEIKFYTNSPKNSILFALSHDRSVVRLMSNINNDRNSNPKDDEK